MSTNPVNPVESPAEYFIRNEHEQVMARVRIVDPMREESPPCPIAIELQYNSAPHEPATVLVSMHRADKADGEALALLDAGAFFRACDRLQAIAEAGKPPTNTVSDVEKYFDMMSGLAESLGFKVRPPAPVVPLRRIEVEADPATAPTSPAPSSPPMMPRPGDLIRITNAHLSSLFGKTFVVKEIVPPREAGFSASIRFSRQPDPDFCVLPDECEIVRSPDPASEAKSS